MISIPINVTKIGGLCLRGGVGVGVAAHNGGRGVLSQLDRCRQCSRHRRVAGCTMVVVPPAAFGVAVIVIVRLAARVVAVIVGVGGSTLSSPALMVAGVIALVVVVVVGGVGGLMWIGNRSFHQ